MLSPMTQQRQGEHTSGDPNAPSLGFTAPTRRGTCIPWLGMAAAGAVAAVVLVSQEQVCQCLGGCGRSVV